MNVVEGVILLITYKTVPNKREDLNIHVINKIPGNNEWKILTKDTSCECKSRFDGCNSN